MYVALAGLTLTLLGGAAWALGRARRTIDWALAAFFTITVVGLLAGLHWTEFRLLVSGQGPFNQGRYLLPLISLMGLATAATVSLVPARRRLTGVAVVLGGLFVLQAFSIALVAGRFYA